VFGILALICIILGFVAAVAKVDILFAPLVWFIAAIAFNTLTVAIPVLGIHRTAE
jgi:hypothetical protein